MRSSPPVAETAPISIGSYPGASRSLRFDKISKVNSAPSKSSIGLNSSSTSKFNPVISSMSASGFDASHQFILAFISSSFLAAFFLSPSSSHHDAALFIWSATSSAASAFACASIVSPVDFFEELFFFFLSAAELPSLSAVLEDFLPFFFLVVFSITS